MALGDIYRVDFEMTNDDKRVTTSIHYEEIVAAVGTQAEVTTQLGEEAEQAFWVSFWQGYASAQLTYIQTVTQQIFPARQAPAISSALNGQVGSNLGDAMNGTTAVVIALYGQAWSPNFRGRAFLPGLPESSADKGRLLSVEYTLIQNDANVFYQFPVILPAPADGSYLPVVFSPSLAGPPPTPPVADIINIVIARPRIGTQRKRRTPVASPS